VVGCCNEVRNGEVNFSFNIVLIVDGVIVCRMKGPIFFDSFFKEHLGKEVLVLLIENFIYNIVI